VDFELVLRRPIETTFPFGPAPDVTLVEFQCGFDTCIGAAISSHSPFPLLVAAVLAEAYSSVRVGIVHRETACHALGIWSHSLHFTSVWVFQWLGQISGPVPGSRHTWGILTAIC
jgi:hypothetical protein